MLVLQGGGALGAYHVGVDEALHEAGIEPDWIAGTSIGAINAAVIAGNAPGDRVAALQALWQAISIDDGWTAALPVPLRQVMHRIGYLQTATAGLPNFCHPRLPLPLGRPLNPGEASRYDVGPMRATLAKLIEFERLNGPDHRVPCGATRVKTGELVYFDNARRRLGVEHILASGALPPAFPPVEVDGDWYWDGNCVSNSPLEAVYDRVQHRDVRVFLVDVWDAQGELPTTMEAVDLRKKQIDSASHTARALAQMTREHDRRGATRALAAAGVDVAALWGHGGDDGRGLGARYDIAHLIYRPGTDELSTPAAEFARSSLAQRRAAGLRDGRRALAGAGTSMTDGAGSRLCVVRTQPDAGTAAKKAVTRALVTA